LTLLRVIAIVSTFLFASGSLGADRFLTSEPGGAPGLSLDDHSYRAALNLAVWGDLPLSSLCNRPIPQSVYLDSVLDSRYPFQPGLLQYLPRWLVRTDFSNGERDWRLYEYLLDDGSFFKFDPRFNLRFDVGEDKTIMRRGSGIQFRGRFKHYFAYSFRFEDRTERGGGPYINRAQLLEDHYGYVGPLQGGKETYYDATEAYLNWANNWLDLTFGKDHVAWGPGRRTNLLFSGDSPSFTHLRAKIRLTNSTQFTYLVGQLHASPDIPLDSVYQTSLGWVRYSLEPKGIAAHRLEYAPSDNCLLAVNEAVIWGERGLDPAYLNPLGFYYSAQHDGGDRDNVMMSGDFIFRIARSGIIYGEVLIDDLKTSKIGKGNAGNRIGWIVGGHTISPGIKDLEFGIEYTRLEPFVYSHFFPINRYSTWNSSLGADIRPNSDRWEGVLSYRPCSEWFLQASSSLNQHGSVGGTIGEAIPAGDDDPVYFLDGVRERWWGWEVEAEWEPLPGAALSAGVIRGARQSAMADRWFVSVGYRI